MDSDKTLIDFIYPFLQGKRSPKKDPPLHPQAIDRRKGGSVIPENAMPNPRVGAFLTWPITVLTLPLPHKTKQEFLSSAIYFTCEINHCSGHRAPDTWGASCWRETRNSASRGKHACKSENKPWSPFVPCSISYKDCACAESCLQMQQFNHLIETTGQNRPG